MHLALTGSSVRRKRHEHHHGPWPQTLTYPCVRTRPGREDCRPRPPSAQLSFPSVWCEAMLSLPSAHVRARKDALTPVRLLRSNSLRIPWEIGHGLGVHIMSGVQASLHTDSLEASGDIDDEEHILDAFKFALSVKQVEATIAGNVRPGRDHE